ncbi:MAG: c-type cytochrome biogenesis protein CcsB, partial [Thermodesulfobacteriota bacterium]|nr:c-type cytochrome biogenesis protein CcsB [Thermodesulfobacteriota bacterium]
VIITIGWCAHTGAIILRWVESYQMGIGHVPLTNLFESMVFFAWAIVLIYLIMELRYRFTIETLGIFASPLAFLAIFVAATSFPSEIQPLVPALQSQWLIYHVVTCFLAYGAFAVSCGTSVLYLIKARKDENNLPASSFLRMFPNISMLDELNYKIVIIGFPMLTLGIITGAAWAYYAWGRYWGWDPKETWSLITWFIYAAFLHARFARGWRGRKTAILSIVGFGAVLFTYLGVNLILSGLHSYV